MPLIQNPNILNDYVCVLMIFTTYIYVLLGESAELLTPPFLKLQPLDSFWIIF